MYVSGINPLSTQLRILQENFFPMAGIQDLSFLLAEAEQSTQNFRCPIALLNWRAIGTSFPMAVQRIFWEIRLGHCYITTWLQGDDSVYIFGNGETFSILNIESILPPHEETNSEQSHTFNIPGTHGETIQIRFVDMEISKATPDKLSNPATVFDILLLHFSNPGICFAEEILCSGSGYSIGLGCIGVFSIRTTPRGSIGKKRTSLSIYPINRVPFGIPEVHFTSFS